MTLLLAANEKLRCTYYGRVEFSQNTYINGKKGGSEDDENKKKRIIING